MFKEEVAQTLQNLSGKTVIAKGKTLSEVFRAFNLQYTCIVTFTKTPTDAVIIVKKGTTTIVPESDGTYALKEGSYTYDVTRAGYADKTAQALVITNADETTGTKTVEVTLSTCIVTFTKTPEDLTLIVKKGTTTLVPEENGTYMMPAGTYSYSATAEGYVPIEDTELVISTGDQTTGTKTVTITLTAQEP